MNTKKSIGWVCAIAAPLAFAVLFSTPTRADDADVVVADFNGADYGAWKVEGDAFGTAPARGTLPGQMEVSGFEGGGLVNSYHGGDRSRGRLTSPEIELTRRYVNFLIGGGVEDLAFELLVDGQVVRSARGPNLNFGGTEALDWESWDVSEFQGRKGVFRITDAASGGWGHLNVDAITLSDAKKESKRNERESVVAARYMLFPINSSRSENWVRVIVDGEVVREFTARLARASDELGPSCYQTSVDMAPWLGKSFKFVVDRANEDEEFPPIEFSEKRYGEEIAYDGKYRPQFHFSPMRGWANDPNGLVYYNGRYHFFFQHNPFSLHWGNMKLWGHATSVDLLHWTEEDDVLYPDRLGSIFSGSAAVDVKNSTGFQTDPNGLPPLVAMFTYNGPSMRYGEPTTQALAYSLDDGKTFVKYEGNPTLPHIVGGNRDPKIFWHEPTQRWIVALYMDGEDYALFASKDLKSWEQLCSIEKLGCSECPDIFELPVDGDETKKLWVFWGGNGKYLLGDFDGQTFKRQSEPLDAKWGGNDYAAQSFSDMPGGRRVQISWMSGGVYPDSPFNQQFTVPRELTLRSTRQGVRLNVYPVEEVKSLRGAEYALQARVSPDELTYEVKGGAEELDLLDVELKIYVGSAKAFSVELRGRKIDFDLNAGTATYEGVVAPVVVERGGRVSLRLVLDRASLELFFNGGLSQIAKCFVPEDENDAPILRVSGIQSAAGVDVRVWPMASVWK